VWSGEPGGSGVLPEMRVSEPRKKKAPKELRSMWGEGESCEEEAPKRGAKKVVEKKEQKKREEKKRGKKEEKKEEERKQVGNCPYA
jgi:hypothetical protein